MTQGTVRKMTDGQRSDLIATMVGVIPSDLTFNEAQAIIGNKGPFVRDIRKSFAKRRIQGPGCFLTRHAIPVGIYGDLMDLERTIKARGCRIGSLWITMTEHGSFVLAKDVATVEIAIVCPLELGFTESVSHQKICERGLNLGLKLCQPEDGPQIMFNYQREHMEDDLAGREEIFLAMQAFVFSPASVLQCHFQFIFCVGYDEDDHWISPVPVDPAHLWGIHQKFAFRK